MDDVLTAVRLLDFDRTAWKQTGVILDDRTNSDLFFVTLEKSEREYSPSTLYKILLFVRQRKKMDGRTMPYLFLGTVDDVSHKGERPISFVWRLRRLMPTDFFRQAKVASA